MNWPLASDYQDAIQNPAQCFQDPQLRVGQPVLTRLGLPRVASGTFASVYEIHNGAQRWAVRCFLRPSVDQQSRYALLSQYLSSMNMSGIVGFAYEAQGIKIRGQWFPIVKMEWVEGKTLHTYISQLFKDGTQAGDTDALRRLAGQWRTLLANLRQRHIAHADLQHGNVLVTPNGDLRLVDYDGMFVPSLQGQPSHELGHANYQHPQRAATDYDEHLDNFSALVIYTSLVALIYDPGLWEKFHTGENLIFSAPDFKAPQKSPVFERLYRSSESLVRDLSQKLALACEGPVWRVPRFDRIIADLPDIPVPQPWWKQSEGDNPPHAGTRAAQTPSQPVAVVSTPAAAKPPAPVTPQPSAHEKPLKPGWVKETSYTRAGALLAGLVLPLVHLWQDAGVKSPAPTPSSGSKTPARANTPLSPGVPRSASKERRGSRWLTCSSVTCLLLGLLLYGIVMLGGYVLHLFNPDKGAETNTPAPHVRTMPLPAAKGIAAPANNAFPPSGP